MMNFKQFIESKEYFLKFHKTGTISPSAYKTYEKEGGLAWLGDKSKHPILLTTKQYGPYEVEFRQSGEPLQYTKIDDEGEIVRDERGMALIFSPEEMKERGLRPFDATIVAFIGNKPIGFASNEWGAAGVWVEGPYQKLGIGSDLLVMFMEDNPRFLSGKSHIGQMTHAGEKMTLKAYDKLEKKRGKNWFKPMN
jgi:hypothetical protein